MYSPGLFLASLISNYESETTRWAGDHSLFSLPRPFLRLLDSRSKGSRKAVTCLDSPFFYPVPGAAPREFFASLLLYDLTYLQFAISHPIPPSSRPFFSSFSFLRRGMCVYVFMIDIYISLLRAPKMRKLQIAPRV